jgi:hypothetical protein
MVEPLVLLLLWLLMLLLLLLVDPVDETGAWWFSRVNDESRRRAVVFAEDISVGVGVGLGCAAVAATAACSRDGGPKGG